MKPVIIPLECFEFGDPSLFINLYISGNDCLFKDDLKYKYFSSIDDV